MKFGLHDINKQEWHSTVEENLQCLNYRIFKQSIHALRKILWHTNWFGSEIIMQMPVVTGRHKNIPRNERFVLFVIKSKLVMNLIMFFSVVSLWKKHIKRYYWKYPNTLKIDKLFNSEKILTLSNLAKFCRINICNCIGHS